MHCRSTNVFFLCISILAILILADSNNQSRTQAEDFSHKTASEYPSNMILFQGESESFSPIPYPVGISETYLILENDNGSTDLFLTGASHDSVLFRAITGRGRLEKYE